MTLNLSNLPSVREIVDKYGINADKKLSQNFLFDQNITDRIVRSAGDLTGVHVLEIGPGPGGLTRSLLHAGAIVTAIEMDKKCVKALEYSLVPAADGRLRIIQGDALNKQTYAAIDGKVRVIANLPYNISTALLTMWLDMPDNFTEYTLMFQKEVATRIMSGPGCKDYGRLSVKVQFTCDACHEFDLPPEAFFPPPKVTSSVITITPHETKRYNADAIILEKLCKAVFGQRRKTLRVSMKQLSSDPIALLREADIDDNRRPEQLTIEEFCELARVLAK